MQLKKLIPLLLTPAIALGTAAPVFAQAADDPAPAQEMTAEDNAPLTESTDSCEDWVFTTNDNSPEETLPPLRTTELFYDATAHCLDGLETTTFEEAPDEPVNVTWRGDVNCDNVIGTQDYLLLKDYLAEAAELTAQGYLNADLNEDDKINYNDLKLLDEEVFCGSKNMQLRFVPKKASVAAMGCEDIVCCEAGDKISVDLAVFHDPGTAGMRLYFECNPMITVNSFRPSTNAYGKAGVWNENNLTYVLTTHDGSNRVAEDGAAIGTFNLTMPSVAYDYIYYLYILDSSTVRSEGGYEEVSDTDFQGIRIGFQVKGTGEEDPAETEENPPASSYVFEQTMRGDVDCNGLVDTADLLLLKAFIAGEAELSAAGYNNACMDGDGIVDGFDLRYLEQMLFPKEAKMQFRFQTQMTQTAWGAYSLGCEDQQYCLPGEEVKLNVIVLNDPGTAGMRLNFDCDPSVTVQSFTPSAEAYGTVGAFENDNMIYTLTTGDGKNCKSENGTLIGSFKLVMPEETGVYHFILDVESSAVYSETGSDEAPDTEFEVIQMVFVVAEETSTFGTEAASLDYSTETQTETECELIPTGEMPGDVNCDGVIGVEDYLLLMKVLEKTADLSEEGRLNADVRQDGVINDGDLDTLSDYINMNTDEMSLRFVPTKYSASSGSESMGAIDMLNCEPGEKIQVNLVVFHDPGTAGMRLIFNAGALDVNSFRASADAYGKTGTWNPETKTYAFTTSDGKNRYPADGTAVGTFNITVPDEHGLYRLSIVTERSAIRSEDGYEEAPDTSYNAIDLVLYVENDWTESTAAETEETPSAETSTEPEPQPDATDAEWGAGIMPGDRPTSGDTPASQQGDDDPSPSAGPGAAEPAASEGDGEDTNQLPKTGSSSTLPAAAAAGALLLTIAGVTAVSFSGTKRRGKDE